jgi:hypothetical protein
MYDQRLIDRLTQYWNSLCRDGAYPEFAQFNASAIEDIWGHCVLFTVTPGGGTRGPGVSFYRIGDKLADLYGQNLVGVSMQAGQRHFQGANIVRRIGEVIEKPSPVTDLGQFVSERGKIVKFRSCMLPFTNHDGMVTHVVAGLSWREF